MNDIPEHHAILNNETIEVSFPFEWELVYTVKGITGAHFDRPTKLWKIPFTPWHASKVLEVLAPLGFYVDPAITRIADQKAPPPKTKYPAGLYPFQRVGVDFLYQAGGRAILADDMGLGKTITALAFVRVFGGRTLVVCPANVVYKWGDEVAKWMPGKTAQIVAHGKDKMVSGIDVTIMSYAIMVQKMEELDRLPFDVVIFDECHYLKSYKAQRTRVARHLVQNGIPKVLMLSGTPFMNRPTELFSLLNMIDPAGFGNFYTYARKYCGAEYTNGMWFVPPDVVTNADELRTRLSRVMIRRTKQDPEVQIDLPDKTRSYLPVELTNKSEYGAAVRDIRNWLKTQDRTVANHKHVLTRLNVLRQIVGEGKIKAAIELADDVLQGGGKVVLFAHHKSVVEKLAQAMLPYGVKMITGDVPQKERHESNMMFQDPNSKIRVMIISVAGAEGIDLFVAGDIIFVEREWTPAKEEQAEDRLHRRGQKHPVTAHYIVAKDTVDEKMAKLVHDKRDLIGQVVPQDEIIETVLEEL